MITPRAGNSFFTARTACCAMPPGFQDSRASRLFLSGGMTGKSAIAGMRSFESVSHSRNSSSIDSRSIPGIETTGWRCFLPSTTNIG